MTTENTPGTWDSHAAYLDGVFAGADELGLRTIHFLEANQPGPDATPEEVEACIARTLQISHERQHQIAGVTPLVEDENSR
jgi:hypothetical protein